MTARAMDNFGLSRLYLVNPREGWPNKKAENSAKHAKSIIKNVILNIRVVMQSIFFRVWAQFIGM